jgi:hypothetical protein
MILGGYMRLDKDSLKASSLCDLDHGHKLLRDHPDRGSNATVVHALRTRRVDLQLTQSPESSTEPHVSPAVENTNHSSYDLHNCVPSKIVVFEIYYVHSCLQNICSTDSIHPIS